MKKAPNWTAKQIQFIRENVGAIKTTEIIRILQRGSIQTINDQCQKNGIKRNPRKYGFVQVMYNGEKYTAKAFTFKRQGNVMLNLTPKGQRDLAKSKAKEARLTINPQKAEKPDNARQQLKVIPKFTPPEGKVLFTLPGTKVAVYRTPKEIEELTKAHLTV